MPKVEYTASKGLFQSSGSGIELNGNTLQGNAKLLIAHTAVSGNLTLTTAQSGAIIKITGNANNQKIVLPAAASSAGIEYDFVVHTAVGNNMKIETNGSETIITCNTSANNAVAITSGTGHCLLTAAGDVAGDRVHIMCDGDKWYATGFSTAASTFASA